MGPLIEQKEGWLYAWRNCGTSEAESYAAFFTNVQVKANIVYSYDDLVKVLNDKSINTQIPRDIISKVLAEYPAQDKQAGKVAA